MLGLSGQGGPLPMGSILGTRVLRTEDPAILRRGGIYTDDVMDERLDGAVHVTFVRSPLAHARIESIDTSAALNAPGVLAVYTGADVELPPKPPFMPMIHNGFSRPLLARDTVRFVG